MTRPIALRADASSTIGVGHVMRSLTLGGALVERGVDVSLATHELPDALRVRAERLGVRVIAADAGASDAFTMLDSYVLPAPAGAHGVIDDNREAPLAGAALVLNQNLHASPAMYADSAARLLLGPYYALLRGELPRVTEAVRADATRVLLAFGGGDPAQLTESTWRALRHCDVRVAIGPANPRRAEIEALGCTLDRGDLVDSYAWADVAVIAAGTTLWEVGYVGLPTVAVVVADNQSAGAKAAEAAGFVAIAEPSSVAARVDTLLHDRERRAGMRAAGHSLFDGRGTGRVADAVIEVANA